MNILIVCYAISILLLLLCCKIELTRKYDYKVTIKDIICVNEYIISAYTSLIICIFYLLSIIIAFYSFLKLLLFIINLMQ